MEDLPIIKWFKETDQRYKRLRQLQKKEQLSEDEDWIYEADLRYCRDKINQLKYAYEQHLEYEKGRAEGREMEKIEMAKRMKEYGLSLYEILYYSGLTEEQLGQF